MKQSKQTKQANNMNVKYRGKRETYRKYGKLEKTKLLNYRHKKEKKP